MGKIVETRLRFEGKTYVGQAMLETTELLFRGEKRLLIPLKDIKSVKTDDDDLVVRFSGGQAVFELGAAEAAKWVHKITNPKSVVEKLGLKPGQKVSVLQVDDPSFLADLEAAGASASTRVKKGSDAIFYGANQRADLDRIPTLKESLDSAGALWVIRPKGVKDITESDVMAAGKAAGLVDVKVVRFSDTHTAEKFVIPLAQR